MDYLPIYLTLADKPCLVVGGGAVAQRKVALLQRAYGQVHLVAPALTPELQRQADAGAIQWRQGRFQDSDIEAKHLVIAATDDSAVNAHISGLCQARGIPVNVVDNAELCSFIVPSIMDRTPVLVSVSTGGASPVLARQLRARLETLIPSTYGRLAAMAEAYRDRARSAIPEEGKRRHFWEEVLQGPIAEMVFAGRDDEAHQALEDALAGKSTGREMGEVYLVGAGPGDPDLLTFRAVRLMQQADVVIYDRLVAGPILDMTRRDAERYYVGKEKDNHAVPQEGINQLLVEHARQGKRVLRLKGGDPFIFGRGGEEIETLAQEGVPFQVVPGITAAAGCASYSGIPLTHRDYAQSVTFVTGHLKAGDLNLNWPALVQPRQTVVFYMGLTGISVISQRLIEHGMSPDTPAALVEQGTTPNQRVFIGTVRTLPEIVRQAEVRAPTLTIVGEVVKLHEKLEWYQAEEHTPGTVFSSHGQAGRS
ncbi:MAG TPA: siroheme synthase CysG [Thiohalobacter sp.]|nr:siroheme synthase CysG [Thiohalobacter sp.]